MVPRRGKFDTRRAIYLVIAVAVVAIGAWYVRSIVSADRDGGKIRIVDAHVINMDKSRERWTEIQEAARLARLPIRRWRAVDGSQFTEDDARRLRVSKLILRHTGEKKQPGVVGCFLSHRTLLEYLANTKVAKADEGHLILEDDAFIPADFWEQWNTFSAELPRDWDIVQIGVTFPNLKRVEGGARVHTHSEARGNVGAFAYVVRHGALSKIVDHLRYMYDPIDVMIRNQQDSWKIYYAWPQICPHNDHGHSTIVPVTIART
jgi:GR25 family glycosyltransferase involved in LPS biosynthesis